MKKLVKTRIEKPLLHIGYKMNFESKSESGLEYTVLHEGTGENPREGQAVMMHYEIWMNEGTMTSHYDYDKEEYVHNIFDSTYDEKSPFSGPIKIVIGEETPDDEVYIKGQSIKGLDEALLNMKVGTKKALLIPSHLAYGEDGGSSFHTFHGYRTPPSQPIRCNIELVDIIDNQDLDLKSIENEPENIAYEG
jgi:FKBP-type peptidyl-prolyl cis-trans isomerase